MRTITRTVAAVAILALALTACSDGGEMSYPDSADSGSVSTNDSGAPATDEQRSADDGFDAVDEDADGEASEQDAPQMVATGAPTGRRVIRTAELTLDVQDTTEALSQVQAVAERVGGFTATSDLRRDEDGVISGTLMLRVPTETLNDVVDELESIGDVVPVNRIDERDVTTEFADVQARIANLTAYEAELSGLLADVRETSDRPEDLLTVFEQVRRVREEIDVLEGRRAALADQISYATVRVTLRHLVDGEVEEEPEAIVWTPGETLRDAMAATGRLLAGLGDGLIWLVVTGLPVLLTLVAIPAIGFAAALRWYRRRPQDERAAGPPQPAGSGQTPPPPA